MNKTNFENSSNIITLIIFPYTSIISDCEKTDEESFDYMSQTNFKKHYDPICKWFTNNRLKNITDRLDPIDEIHLRYFCAEQQWIYLLCTTDSIQDVFYKSCKNGYLNIVKWINTLPCINSIRFDIAFQKAFINGCSKITEWLEQNYPESTPNYWDESDYRHVCRLSEANGHYDIVKQIKNKY